MLPSAALLIRLEVSVISLHTYPFAQDRYIILPHGASMGSGYGLVVITREPMSPEDVRDVEIAVPGRMTTAYLVLRLFLGDDFRHREVAFDRIMEDVRSGGSDAGLLIHEGQLTYERQGFHRVVDLGEWWLLETGLPLPLGINVARRDLGAEILRELCEVLAESIQAGLSSRVEALAYAMQCGRGLDPGSRGPLRRDVRERADAGLRRRGPAGSPRASRARRASWRLRRACSGRVRHLVRK